MTRALIRDFTNLHDFIAESNRIEGIYAVSQIEIGAHETLLALPSLQVSDVEAFVSMIAPEHVLRTKPGMNVRVGNHIAPKGGPAIAEALAPLLFDASCGFDDPYTIHVKYETLHPFTDGNGRSGRAIWAWQMKHMYGDNALSIGFLHRFYYQTLEHYKP